MNDSHLPSEPCTRPGPRECGDSQTAREDLIEAIAQAELPPAALARAFDLSLHDLAAWVSDPAKARAIEQLAWLAELRAKMLLAQFRATGVARLAHIANGEPSELARKACVDLLKSKIELPANLTGGHGAPEPPSAEAILALLESIGADHGEDHVARERHAGVPDEVAQLHAVPTPPAPLPSPLPGPSSA
jgi:hypothetical protein